MEGPDITAFLRHRRARYRELLSKTAHPGAAARYRDFIDALDSLADAMPRAPEEDGDTPLR